MVSPEQIVLSTPAFTLAAGLTVMVTVSMAGPQGPSGSPVSNVKITVPLPIAGVYTAFNVLAFGEKLPLGALHVAEPAPPPKLPARVTEPSAHTVWATPAFTVAAGLMVTTILSLTG